MAKFIKVTPKGETTPRIVLASLKAFYISQGAKIETPTDEEVYAVEPGERPAECIASQTAEIERLQTAVDNANKTIASLKERLAKAQRKTAASSQE